MHNLVHELLGSKQSEENLEKLTIVEDQLNMLSGMKISQESIEDSIFIQEYDSVSRTIVAGLFALTESYKKYDHNRRLQKIVNAIRETNLHEDINRSNYDLVAGEFNKFIEQNREFLSDKDQNLTVEKKPLFQVVTSSQ